MAICAIATAPGRGGIAVIRVSGDNTFPLIEKLLEKPLPQQPRLATYRQLRNLQGELLDDVVITTFRAPHSFTGDDTVEIACHGSTFIQQEILKALREAGCEMAGPGEFTQRAFLNGRLDLSQAEAVADLINAESQAMHRVAMSQMRGGVSEKLAQMRDKLLELTSLLELELDFGDHEELEFADRSELSQITADLLRHIERLKDSFNAGNAIKNGIPVAIVGAPNVGKSSMLNALLGEERAIVTDIPGTTRDIIEDTMQLGGYTFRFIDTAGIRSTTDTIEQIGIERSYQQIEKASVVLYLTDQAPDADVLSKILSQSEEKYLVGVSTKSDLNHAVATAEAWKTLGFEVNEWNSLVVTSSKTDTGLDALKQQLCAIAQKLTATETDVIITNARHHEALSRAHESLLRVADALQMGISGDLIAQDLRETLHHLGLITGQITTTEVLHNIFSKFCIGK
ncbi:MAG: tRNA uridine-5-carboxymethylaminomethyl(34) synthesis GTPase MnmE [Paludibacteraceae bacterium]|nr:tRNA uridine-5-carboxymethylaminomethyl(34) synthesis GTPase MnmE [Paludibacteraceae bacterium]